VDAGGIIDCRDPNHIKVLDPREQPFDTHLGVDAIAAALRACPDRELVSMLRGGVTLKTGMTPQIVIMPNLNSLYSGTSGVGLDAVTDALHDLVGRGWYSTHEFIPFVPWRCAPRGAVERPGGGVPRGIVDNGGPRRELRTQPSGHPVESVNSAAGPMRPPPGTADVDTKWHLEDKPWFADACTSALILGDIGRRSGQPVFTFSFDFKFFFHQLFLRYGEWWLVTLLQPLKKRSIAACTD
jgi:hypothetical protein